METDCNLKALGKRFEILSARIQKIDICNPSLISIRKLRLHLSLDVQRYCFLWVRSLSANFRTVLTKNLRNLRDLVHLMTRSCDNMEWQRVQ